MSNSTGEMRAVEGCYQCGGPLLDGQFKILKSDQMTDFPNGVWIDQKYCVGEGTLNCASLPREVRRGPLYDEWITYDAADLHTEIQAKSNSDDDACDE